jgi:WD40 repeat protein
VNDLAYQTSTGGAQYDISRSGTLIYRKAGGAAAGGLMTLNWLESSGKKEPMHVKPGAFQHLHVSPDGKKIAMLVNEGGKGDIWVYDTQRDANTRLTFSGGPYFDPIWSPDGRYVVIGSLVTGLLWTRSDGASQPQPLASTLKGFEVPWSFLPDGKRLAYFQIDATPQLWTVALEDNNGQLKAGQPEQFLKSQFQDVTPTFSPDGKWIAYMSNATGSNEIYVRAYPPPASGQAGQWQISNGKGMNPKWTAHDLLYQSDDQIMAVAWTVKDGSFVPAKPRVWLSKLGGPGDWDLAPDGKHIAALIPVGTPEAPRQEHEVVFLQNLSDELRRRAPLQK